MIDFHYDLISQEDGSVQKVIKSLVNNLELDVSCMSVSIDRYKITQNKVKYYTIPENKLKNKIFNKILNLKVFTYDKMVDIINKERFDILHFHNRFELVDKLIAKLDYKPKVIIHFHREFNTPIIPKNCDLIIGVSKALIEFIKDKTNTKVKTKYLHNAISYDVFDYPKKNYEQIIKPKMLFAFGGNDKKGYKEVLGLLEFSKDKEFELHICGNKKELNINYPNVKVYGFLKKEDLYNLMQECNILLFPSYSEGLPMTILESLYFGMYVIPSKVGGIPEIFGDKYQFYCELNSESLYQKIIQIQKVSPLEYQEMRDFILKKFDIKNIIKDLENIYQKLYKDKNVK